MTNQAAAANKFKKQREYLRYKMDIFPLPHSLSINFGGQSPPLNEFLYGQQ